MPGGLNSGLEGYPFLVYTCYGNKMLFVVEFLFPVGLSRGAGLNEYFFLDYEYYVEFGMSMFYPRLDPRSHGFSLA